LSSTIASLYAAGRVKALSVSFARFAAASKVSRDAPAEQFRAGESADEEEADGPQERRRGPDGVAAAGRSQERDHLHRRDEKRRQESVADEQCHGQAHDDERAEEGVPEPEERRVAGVEAADDDAEPVRGGEEDDDDAEPRQPGDGTDRERTAG
jgi:hypothetical protein